MGRVPPLLPAEAFKRVARLARFDGTSVLAIGAAFGFAAALAHDQSGTLVGLLAAGAGAVELHGLGLLHHGEERGWRWLVLSQFGLLAVILGYCVIRLEHVDLEPMRPYITAEQKRQIAAAGMTVDQFLGVLYRATYYLVAALSVGYQGGMVLFYARRREAIVAALHDPSE